MDTIEGMKTFIAVATAGSFTAAARQLGRSTALVSKYVGQLEDRLHVRLLERTTRSLRLTELGEVYLQHAEELVGQLDALEAGLRARRHVPSGTLRISAPVTFGEDTIARVVSRYVERWPQVEVDLRLTDRFVNLVDEGIDLAIRITQLSDSTLIARRLCSVPTICCASPSYLARRDTPAVPNDLRQHCCIVDRNLRNPSAWPFSLDGVRTTVNVAGRIRVNGARAARTIVLEGGGVGFIPRYAIERDLALGRIVVLLAEYHTLDFDAFAVYQHRQHLASKTRAFVDLLVEHFAAADSVDERERGNLDEAGSP